MPAFVRNHAATFAIAFVTAMVAGGSFVWAHNAPSEGHVTRAHTADKVRGMTVLPLKKVSSSAESDSGSAYNDARAAAQKVTLFQKDPFTVYLKCFTDVSQSDNPFVLGEIYVDTSGGKAIFSSDNDDGSGNGYIDGSTPEDERQILTTGSAAGPGNPGVVNITDAEYGIFYAVGGSTHIEGQLFLGTKVGTPEAGNGPFGSGNRRCLAGGTINWK